jgi:hypothetical protein
MAGTSPTMTENHSPTSNAFALGFTRCGDYKRANVES